MPGSRLGSCATSAGMLETNPIPATNGRGRRDTGEFMRSGFHTWDARAYTRPTLKP